MRGPAGLVLGTLLLLSTPLSGQVGGVSVSVVSEWDLGEPSWSFQQAALAPPSDAAAAAGLSLLVPGVGQHRLNHSRKWLFGAVEVLSWALFAERRAAGSSLRDAYRDFAWQRGRVQAGSRTDGDFDYYETLSKWQRSGAFDVDAATPGVQPEPDVSSYNGTIWNRARGLFMGGSAGTPSDPGYERARDYYTENAYSDEFLWDWTGDAEGQLELGTRIEESDSRFRQATTAVGVIIVNHLVSSIDAFLIGRSRDELPAVSVVGLPGPRGATWSLRLELPVGR